MAQELTIDLDQVRQHLAAMQAQGKGDLALETAIELLIQVYEQNESLRLRNVQLLKQLYGRRTEKVDPRQMALLLAGVTSAPAPTAEPAAGPEADAPADETDAPAPAPTRPAARKRPPTGRKPLPAHLPRFEQIHEPPAEERHCSEHGVQKRCIGEERSEVLELEPPRFKVLVQIRRKYACPVNGCESSVVIAPVPDKVIDGGLPGPGLLADALVSKFRDHLPLHRISGIYRREGVEIADSTLGHWVAESAELVAPVADAIFEQAMAAHVVQADDTGLRVLDKSAPKGVKKGHLWCFVGDGKHVAFRQLPTWSGEPVRELLAGRQGWVQTDGYKGLDKLFEAPGATQKHAGCWAHARRKFVEALDGGDVRAAVPVDYIRRLYAIEHRAREEGLDADGRLRLRQQESAPVMAELSAWAADKRAAVPPKSPLGRALGYASNQWSALSRFLEDGALELDNNRVEREVRAVACGRKAWLFAGSDAGAWRATVFYTLFANCAQHRVNPWAYLRAVLEKLSAGWPQSRLGQLLPEAWAAAHPEHRMAGDASHGPRQ